MTAKGLGPADPDWTEVGNDSGLMINEGERGLGGRVRDPTLHLIMDIFVILFLPLYCIILLEAC